MLPCDILDKKLRTVKKYDGRNLNIAVVGHGYNLYDRYANMNMLDKLIDKGAEIITVDMVDGEIIEKHVQVLPKRLFWNFGRKAVGSSLYFLDREDIDGIIYLMAFGCRVDSFISDLIERKIRRNKDIPFIILTLDEHTGKPAWIPDLRRLLI